MAQNNFTNKLILGDNLIELQKLPEKSVDLIYLDPPFFSNRTYEVIWGDDGEVRSFEDRFAGGIDHYISWLKIRVRQMHRILKDTGSIFLHCDWHANAEIKIDILNKIFGRNNFRNEIVWCYTGGTDSKNRWQRKHDTIFFYTKSKNYTYNGDFEEFSDNTLKRFNKEDEKGRYKINKLFGGRITKTYMKKEGKRAPDYWYIPIVNRTFAEGIGYPTQKPEALLQRIIECCTNEGDVVLDPFLGGGTTIDVANRLNRKWIGIDQSVMAIKVSDLRLKKRQNELFAQPYEVVLPTYDFSKLQSQDGKEF
ncbi:MAG: site-specific DNA-methyltransferase, partial [Prevotellaceae bacterium]|nr:site-specific DNA-methyltransferase [Prevotellaceae bacterium]